MTNITEDLAALLAEHRFSVTLHGCTCRRWTFSVAGNRSTLEVLVQHEDHVAEVIAAAGWMKGREEWGVRYSSHVGNFEQAKISEHVARVVCEEERDDLGACAEAVIRRYVTDWEQA